MNQANSAAQWWLLDGESTCGPFSAPYIQLALASGKFSRSSLACLVGTQEWRPLGVWNEFANGPDTLPPNPYAAAPMVDRWRDRGRQLPEMAQVIFVYAVMINPALWILSNLTCLATGAMFVEGSGFFAVEVLMALVGFFVGLATLVLLIVGGLQLRAKRKVGRTLLLTGFSINFGYAFISLFLMVAMLAAAASDPTAAYVAQDTTEPSDAEAFLGLLFLLIYMAAFFFEVFAFFWLLFRKDQLHLR